MATLKLTKKEFPRRWHVCAFFQGKDDEYEVLGPFIREGLEAGEKAFHIVDPSRKQEHVGRLKAAGADVDAALEKKQLEVLGWDQAYLREGRFNQHAMLDLVEALLSGPSTRGYPGLHLIADMEWAREGLPGVDDLLEYESRANYILPKFDHPII